MSKRYSCHKISEGKAQAEAIKTHDRIMFYQVRPEDGVMEEKDHELLGRSISQKVLLFPGGVHLGTDNIHKVGAIGVPGYGWKVKIVDEQNQPVKQGGPTARAPTAPCAPPSPAMCPSMAARCGGRPPADPGGRTGGLKKRNQP